MKAMILAAGKGTRLHPLTNTTPKVLLSISGTPVIEHQLVWLRRHGITDVVINLHYLGSQIKSHLGDGSQLGMSISYSEEETLLGTAGGVRRVLPSLSDPFVVVYGDVLTDLDLVEMSHFHHDHNAVITLAVIQMPDLRGAGVVSMSDSNRVIRFAEKEVSTQRDGLGSGGIYILNKQAVSYLPDGKYADFGYNVLPRLINSGKRVFGYLVSPSEYLVDIGSIENYEKISSSPPTSQTAMRRHVVKF